VRAHLCTTPAEATFCVRGERYHRDVSRRSPDLPPSSLVVVTNPDEDTSPEAFHAFLDELLAGPEPELESIGGAEVLHELRADSDA
jgi:hypothetical protein